MKNLYIKQKIFKITDHYSVLDENENEVYFVDQDFTFLGKRVNVSDKDKKFLFKIEREILTFMPRFNITFYDGGKLSLQSRFKLFSQKIDVLPKNSNISLEGDFLSHDFEIYKEGKTIGNISKAYFSFSDTFKITVEDEKYELLLLAMMIAVDDIIDCSQSN